MTRIAAFARTLVSPAALCLWFVFACVSFSVAGSNASRHFVLRHDSMAAAARVAIPIEMKRWDEALFNKVVARAKADMADFVKGVEHDAELKPKDVEQGWQPSRFNVRFIEQFRGLALVSYLEITAVSEGGKPQATTFRTVNFDKAANLEMTLGDLLDGLSDQSKALQALADYARADLKDQLGEDEESDALSEMTKPDVNIYSRFTFCPSTKLGKAAGLTIHFATDPAGPYAASTFRVTIPPTVFSKYLRPGMKPLFAGEPRQAPVTLDDSI